MFRRTTGALGAVLLLLLGTPAHSADVLIIQSSGIEAFDQAVQTFERAFDGGAAPPGPGRAERHQLSKLILAHSGAGTTLDQRLHARPPELVLAVGTAALAALSKAPDLPTVYLLVPNPEHLVAGRRRTTGVLLDTPPAASLDALLKLVPRVRRVGVVYDPARTGPLVAEAIEAARHRGVAVVARPVRSAVEVPGRLASMRGEIDALWMLPDLTAITPETVEALLLFSVDGQVPVLTFSERYLELGATLSVTFDAAALGEKAAELAHRLLNISPEGRVPATRADRFRVRVNDTAAGKLGLVMVDDPSRKRAR